jgi:NAD(P)-dependent dehydrogenase (short-subunit alcohol dehydrogenase family)
MKEAVHADYLDHWKEATKDYTVATRRIAIVVGAEHASSIGAAIAYELVQSEYDVVTPTKAQLNVTYADEVRRFLHNYPADTLILANGTTHMDWIEDYPEREMERVVGDTLTGSMIATSEFVRATINNQYLKYIVYIGSMAHRGVLNASAPYCAAKAGLNHFARCMGWELTPKGYRVFVVHPSNTIGTPMTEETIRHIMRYRGLNRQDAEAYWASINLMPEWLHPEDIARTVRHLVSGSCDYQSGTAIELSGGQR